jgi:hypothetical protein
VMLHGGKRDDGLYSFGKTMQDTVCHQGLCAASFPRLGL